MRRWWVVVLGAMVLGGLACPVRAQGAAPPAEKPAAAEDKTPTAADYLAEADALMAKKDYSKALSKYLMSWLQGPENTVVLDRIGDLFMVTNKAADATRFYAVAIRLDPRMEEPVLGLAQAYLTVKRVDQALLLLDEPGRKAIFGKSVRYQQLLGRTYIFAGKPAQAIPVLKAAIAQAPQMGSLYGELGNACLMAKKYADAADAYAKALEKDPKDATAALYRSMALEKLEKWGEAVAALQTYLTLTNPPADHAERKRLETLQAKVPK
jgi:tetratricopeptide (TPR) repeat protein